LKGGSNGKQLETDESNSSEGVASELEIEERFAGGVRKRLNGNTQPDIDTPHSRRKPGKMLRCRKELTGNSSRWRKVTLEC